MKKLFILFAVALLSGVAAYAQNIEDIRIYINPGHGSWGPNNRHMATIGHNPISSENPDTTDFYESNTNLWKCLELFHKLKDYGFKHNAENALDLSQNLVMSRIASGPYPYETVNGVDPDQNNAYNRTLSTIVEEVKTNNFDMFISVHSNAATEGNTTNYLYFIYRTNKGADEATCVEMCEKGWNHRILDRHTQWTHYDNQVGAGSVKIGTGDYQVLAHNVPGYLVEGYFHTYQPARHRAMNRDACTIEGLAYARGVADYFDIPLEETGEIYGIVRDKHEKFSDPLYTPRAGTDDIYKPLNGITVVLKKDGNQVATYTTDNNYNGGFVFKNLEAGEYTLEFVSDEYLSGDPIAVTVEPAKTSWPTAFLESADYVPPTIVYENYPDSTAGKAGYSLAASYDMTAKVKATVAELEGKTVRHSLVRDNKAYILALDAENTPYVYIYDIAGQKMLKTLGTTAAVGDILKISDIALTADGYLVGINKATQAYNGENCVKAYKWAMGEDGLPEGEAEIWWDSNFAGNWTTGISGESCYYNGTLEEGEFVYTGQTAGDTGFTRIIFASISDSKYIGYMRNNNIAATDGDEPYLDKDNLGDSYNLTLSPRADDQFVLNSAKSPVVEYQKNPTDVGLPTILGAMGEDVLPLANATQSFFRYAGRSAMITPDVNAEGLVQGLRLFDITDGVDKAVEIETNCTIEPTAFTYASAYGETEVTLKTDDSFDYADIVFYLIVDGKVTKWEETVLTAYKPATDGTANPFAYALSSEIDGTTLNVKYSLNTAATNVDVVVKDSEGEVVLTSVEGDQAAGEHTANLDLSNVEDGTYTWAVVVEGSELSAVKQFVHWDFYHPAGLAVDNSTESPSFGHLFVADAYTDGKTSGYISAQADGSEGTGLYVFDAAGNQVKDANGNTRFFGKSLTVDINIADSQMGDFLRVGVAGDGRIFVARGGDSGEYLLVAESLAKLQETGEFTSLVAGQAMTSCVYNDNSGNFMLGPVQAMSVYGSGENTKILAITRNSTDLSGAFQLNNTFEYNIGTANTLPTPTPVAALDGLYTISYNHNVCVEYDNEGGIWYCQYRSEPSNTQPALVYVNPAGEEMYFEGTGGKVRRNAGIAVSPDGKYLAAMSAAKELTIYRINHTSDGAIGLKEAYILTTDGNNMYELAWDIAGNLYASNATSEYVRGFAMPRSETAETAAASIYAFQIKNGTIGIEDVDAEYTDVPAVYYNLQGVQVSADELIPGIYVKVQGNKAEKVVVR